MNPDRHFCTLFDRNYLLKGVVMLESLIRHCPGATVHVLCMDDTTYEVLEDLKLPAVELMRLPEVEDEDLLRVKPGRSIAEYCWTLSSSFPWYLMRSRPRINMLTYVDADLRFFSSVDPLFAEIGSASVAIIEHRFAPKHSHMEAAGRFNVEWVGFRRSPVGLACLTKWRDQCIEWCFARVEEGRMGDQKYLDDWPETYGESVHILQHPGAGIAPWNFSSHRYAEHGADIYVDDDSPLIFYHFNQFQILSGGRFDYMSSVYSQGVHIPTLIYHRYESDLLDVLRRVRTVEPRFNDGIRAVGMVKIRRMVQRFFPMAVKNVLRRAGIQSW